MKGHTTVKQKQKKCVNKYVAVLEVAPNSFIKSEHSRTSTIVLKASLTGCSTLF